MMKTGRQQIEYILDGDKLKKSIWIKRRIHDEIGISEMCKKIGISRSTLHRFEKGKEIDLSTFLKLCAYTEISPSAFIILK